MVAVLVQFRPLSSSCPLSFTTLFYEDTSSSLAWRQSLTSLRLGKVEGFMIVFLLLIITDCV
jgi:hypothetical protein